MGYWPTEAEMALVVISESAVGDARMPWQGITITQRHAARPGQCQRREQQQASGACDMHHIGLVEALDRAAANVTTATVTEARS